MKKGSALLIVLGMISFMVISAVAFSALMRSNRLPSSYLRRTSSARHLAHAAVAEAIDIIDNAIGDNPHPGVGLRASVYPRDGGRSENRNWWRDSCYIGSNQLVNAEETVSTLNLEALAYLPPSRINDARFFSRRSDAARWHDLGYDAGRFAFCAIDVSDCFNLNRVPANWARSSADLGKISLGVALEDASHTGYAVNPSAWDAFMENFVDFDKIMDGLPQSTSKLPLFSLADFNLAVYAPGSSLKGSAQYLSPFCMAYANSGGNVTYVNDPEGQAGAETMRSLNVITDGYFPSLPVQRGSRDEADIQRAEDQPFTQVDPGDTQPDNHTVLSRIRTTGIGGILSNELPPLDMINLYDYLDENDIPTSLGLPTTERVPMIGGLQAAVALKLIPSATVEKNPANTDSLPAGQTYTETTICKLGLEGVGAMTPLLVYPFRHDEDVAANYPVEAAARICLATGAPGLRVGENSRYIITDNAEFTAGGGGDNSTLRAKVSTASFTVQRSLLTQAGDADSLGRKAIKADQNLNVDLQAANGWLAGQTVLKVVRTFVLDPPPGGLGSPVPRELEDQRTAEINPAFRPLAPNGIDDGGFTVDVAKSGGSVKVRPYMSVAVRVKCEDGATVDLVPASGLDDQRYNNVNTDLNLVNISGNRDSLPVIVFAGDKEIDFGENWFKGGEPVSVQIQPGEGGGYIMCPDPRWNFAPENFVLKSGSISASAYYDEIKNNFLNNAACDGDIFMAVSNQGYLQSVSELAFLPRTAVGDFGSGSDQVGDCQITFDRNAFATGIDQLPHRNLMWRTYRLWSRGGLAADPLYDLGIFDGGRGPRVSPYASADHLARAAFANAPYSWWAASTNYNAVGKANVPDDDAASFNQKYAFSAHSSKGTKLAFEDVQKVANRVHELIALRLNENDDGNWIRGWQEFWNYETGDLGDVEMTQSDELLDIDRKFLYGYWRDCLMPKQQLFLIFVRAEPLMMGGGAIGQTPPQLGARAVALVWRSPAPGSFSGLVATDKKDILKDFSPQSCNAQIEKIQSGFPHQTRVLFYRQFD